MKYNYKNQQHYVEDLLFLILTGIPIDDSKKGTEKSYS